LLYQKNIERNVVLLDCACISLSLEETNKILEDRVMKTVPEEAWGLWVNFYKPLAEANQEYKNEIIYNDRSLAWFARDLNRRYKKSILS
jgi:hypothetical protein